MTQQRKLAAIMFTDLVGYVALSQRNEALALELLKEHQELLRPLFTQHHGTEIKTIGDAFLVEFGSAVEAARCAVDIQKALMAHTSVVTPERRIQLRIGLHVGDVVYEEGDMLGDGVNIASRIEPLAEPGGICISEDVAHQVRNKIDGSLEMLGERKLKGITEPVTVYRLVLPWEKQAGFLRLARLALRKPVSARWIQAGVIILLIVAVWLWRGREADPLAAFKHSVAVMPFDNLTGDDSFDIWEKGMATLLITALSTSKELYVLDSQTLFDVMNAVKSAQTAQVIPQLAREVATRTKVKTVILGDILKAGEKLRLQARLLEVKSGGVTFSLSVNGNSEDDFFTMAQSLSDRLKDHLEIRVLREEAELDLRAGGAMTTSAAAYRHLIQGSDAFWQLDFVSAIKAFTRAVEIDTVFAGAYIFKAFAHGNLGQAEEARSAFYKADRLKKGLQPADLAVLEIVRAIFINKDPYAEIQWLKKRLDITPLSRPFWYQLGNTYYNVDQYARAVEPLEKALALSDRWGSGWAWVPVYTVLGSAYHELGRHEREIEVYEKGLSVLPNHPRLLGTLASEFIFLGDSILVDVYLTRHKTTNDERGWSQVQRLRSLGNIYRRAGDVEQAQRLWRQALAIDPQQSTVLISLASLLIDHDLEVDEGIALAAKALELVPENYAIMDTYGWGLYKQGKYTEAVKVLERAWELRPSYSHDQYQHLEAARYAVAGEKQ